MDTTQTYVDKCRAATEIQDAWQPRHGDLAWDEECGMSVCVAFRRGRKVWLPYQDQLQALVPSLSVPGAAVPFLGYVLSWEDEDGCYPNDAPQTWEQLWLGYVMETNYHKQWNDETKEWERDDDEGKE